MLWKEEEIQINVLVDTSKWVLASMINGSLPRSMPASLRKDLWSDLAQLAGTITEPWLIAGDFNVILSPDEKRRGAPATVGKYF